ncbi:hypothetical protein SCHPADRAFT_443436 [Schizopora paradoxa]|uniref:Uncharacterized protein n=1 Tax=Schizopora paradoxa TaxID=27342 RepID=A0A0H2RRD4_9AGAM|nr:hypothetical protein SCHPADRAFT_443436 [Schizopora paradoxa]
MSSSTHAPVDKPTIKDTPPHIKDSDAVPEPDTTKPPSSSDLDDKLAKLDLSTDSKDTPTTTTEDAPKVDEEVKPPLDSAAASEGEEKKLEKDGVDAAQQQQQQKGPKKTPTKPYVNPDRFLTGGSPREKLSPEELEKKIARIRENNEKIKQRQLTIQADEDAFKATQSAEIKKQAQNKKIQEGINRNREQNAQRKMERMNNREWDSNKKRPGPGQKDKVPAQGQTTSQGKDAERAPATNTT